MCGIFGFISSEGKGPEVARLRRLALITQSRGDHAFGLAWLDEDGSIQTFKRPGPAKAYCPPRSSRTWEMLTPTP